MLRLRYCVLCGLFLIFGCCVCVFVCGCVCFSVIYCVMLSGVCVCDLFVFVCLCVRFCVDVLMRERWYGMLLFVLCCFFL